MALMVASGLRRIALPSLCAFGVLLCGLPPARGQEAPKVAGTDVPAPKRTKTVLPQYPPDAQAEGIRGIVILNVVIDTQGHVASAEVLRSIPGLDAAAVEAVRNWEFEVTKVEGKPVAVRLTVPITFTIKAPEVIRAKGIPDLQQGVPPAYPGELKDKSATVTVQVALDSSGSVVDALIISGESPWTGNVLRALRTWKFAVDAPGTTLAFKLEAKFSPGTNGGTPQVALRLSDPRRGAPGPEAAAAAPAPSPTPASPTPTPVTTDLTQATPSPAGTAIPATPPASQPAAPVPTPTPTPTPTPPPPQQPPVEMIPAPPPQALAPLGPTRVPENGVSSIRDVTLLEGIPDLVKGRHPVPPPLARINGVTGAVTVRFAVNAAGVTSVESVDGPDLLKPAAQDTVVSWDFRRTAAERLHLVAAFDYGADTATATVRIDDAPPAAH